MSRSASTTLHRVASAVSGLVVSGEARGERGENRPLAALAGGDEDSARGASCALGGAVLLLAAPCSSFAIRRALLSLARASASRMAMRPCCSVVVRPDAAPLSWAYGSCLATSAASIGARGF